MTNSGIGSGEAASVRLYGRRPPASGLTGIKHAGGAGPNAMESERERSGELATIRGKTMSAIGNRPFDSLKVGDEDRLVHTLTPEDFSLLATQAATMGAGLIDPAVAASRAFSIDAGQTGWASALMSALIAGRVPGAGIEARPPDDRVDEAGAAGRRHDDRRQGCPEVRGGPAGDDRGARHQPARRPRDGRHGRGRRAEEGGGGRAARRLRRGDAREGPALQAAHRGDALDEADPDRGRASGRRGLAHRARSRRRARN